MNRNVLSIFFNLMMVIVNAGMIITFVLQHLSNKKKKVSDLELNNRAKEIDKFSEAELIEDIKTIRCGKIRKKSIIVEMSSTIITAIFAIFSVIYITVGKNQGVDISNETSISFSLLSAISILFVYIINNADEKYNAEMSREREKLLVEMELQLQKKHQEAHCKKMFMDFLDENISKEKEFSLDLGLKINSKSINSESSKKSND